MVNRTVTNNPGNRGSQPSEQSTSRGQGERSIQPDEGNPVPAGNPLGNQPQPDVTDRGKAPAPANDSAD